MKADLREVDAAKLQISIPVQGVLADVHHAFLGLCVDAGAHVIAAMMEADRTALCGQSGVPDAHRVAVRGGNTKSQIVVGGKRISISRPRVRTLDCDGERGAECELPSYVWARNQDPLNRATMAAIAAGVSTRRYASTQEPIAEDHKPCADSKSAVSRRFVQMSQAQLSAWLAKPLTEHRFPVIMVDGIHYNDRVMLIALGIDDNGEKHILGLREGATESTGVVGELLSDLIGRGLDTNCMRLWVIDGARSLRRAIMDRFANKALIQRCQVHKKRNVLDHLPEAMHASVGRALGDAWASADVDLAKRQLTRLANSLEAQHPGAAASLREGLDETLTVQALEITGALYKTLRTTNPIENLNGTVARYCRNVKRWKDGHMVMRWVASALSDASTRMRKLRGYRDIKALIKAMNNRAAINAPSHPAASKNTTPAPRARKLA